MTNRYRRQSFLGEESSSTFEKAIVAIVGLCGGGSHVAQQLAHIGFKHFKLFDPDSVDETNLNRMIGSAPSDAKNDVPKTEVVRRAIGRIQPDATVEAFPDKWQIFDKQLRDSTIVFGCVDSFEARDQLEAFCRRFLLPYIDIGMDVHEISPNRFTITGQVITSLPGGPCMRCMGFISDERLAQEVQRYGNAGERPQVVWPNGVLASTAVGIAVSLLAPWGIPSPPSLVEYDGNRMELRQGTALGVLGKGPCVHYTDNHVGDAFWASPRG